MKIHLKKLCVGAIDVRDLSNRQSYIRQKYNETIHITRMFPKKYNELLDGGSIYWVFKSYIRARQNIIGIDRIIGDDNIKRCKILLSKEIMLTYPKKTRPFQGWRYLQNKDVPKDHGVYDPNNFDNSNEELISELNKLGLV
tara:strand:+ start:1738 stop:2160 length:423 start_codon:yes stop_codon:yes gene_type:complete